MALCGMSGADEGCGPASPLARDGGSGAFSEPGSFPRRLSKIPSSNSREIGTRKLMSEVNGHDRRSSGPFMSSTGVGQAELLSAGAPGARERMEAALAELTASISKVQAEMAQAAGNGSGAAPAPVGLVGSMESRPGVALQEPSEMSRGFKSDEDSEHTTDENVASPIGLMMGPATSVHADTLPEHWPSSLEARWDQNEVGKSKALGKLTRSSGRKSTTSTSGPEALVAQKEAMSSATRRWWIIHPNSTAHSIYDFAGAFFLAFDILVIPWMLCWDIALEGFLMWMAWITGIYWTLDIAMSFLTAIISNGELITEPCAIAKRYTRTWFFLDIAICSCDWASIVILSSPSWRSLRFARATRLLRLTSLARLAKVFHVISQLLDELLPDELLTSITFLRCFVNTLVIAHFASCIWFFIGRAAPSDTGNRWTDQTPLDDEPAFIDSSQLYQYSTCLHWAVSSITLGGYVPAEPHSTIERIYSAICLTLGLLFGGALISILSTTMLETQMAKRENNIKLKRLRRYMKDYKVDRSIAVRVYGQLADRLATKEKLREEQVTGLQHLSWKLRSELSFGLFKPQIKRHSLFKLMAEMNQPFMQRFCRMCMSFTFRRRQDDLCVAGRSADTCWIFVAGSLVYTQEPDTSPLTHAQVYEIEKGQWISEAALWSNWIHVGTASALLNSELVEIRVQDMWEYMQMAMPVVELAKDYGRKFHKRIQMAGPPHSRWPDDLQVPATSWTDLVLAMEMESQIVIGLECIEQESEKSRFRWGPTGTRDRLAHEVRTGKTVVTMGNDGEMERIVSVVVVNMENSEGKILVQLGEYSDGRLMPHCNLPGGRQSRGEMVLDTLHRVMEGNLSPFSSQLSSISDLQQETRIDESKEIGVQTRYIRNIVSVRSECSLRDMKDMSNVTLLEATDVALAEQKLRNSGGFHSEISMRMGSKSSKSSGIGTQFKRLGSHSHSSSTVYSPSKGSYISPSKVKAAKEYTERRLMNRTVMHIGESRTKGGMFAWLTEREFEQLKGPTGEDMILGWLSSIHWALADKPAVEPTVPDVVPELAAECEQFGL